MPKPNKQGKRSKGRFTQLTETLQSSEAWRTMKPGPRALYVELKRRYKGNNNGEIYLSHREAAVALNVHRNTVGAWFEILEMRGFIRLTEGHHLGPSGIGRASRWALEEVPTEDGKRPTLGYLTWTGEKKPRTNFVPPRHTDCPTGRAEPLCSNESGTVVVT